MGGLCRICPPISFFVFYILNDQKVSLKAIMLLKNQKKVWHQFTQLQYNSLSCQLWEDQNYIFVRLILLIPPNSTSCSEIILVITLTLSIIDGVLLFVGCFFSVALFSVNYLLMFNTEDLLRSTKFETATLSKLSGFTQILRQHKDCTGVRIQGSRTDECVLLSRKQLLQTFCQHGIAAW